jgi:phospholipid/cholesterol/gamma-HCH transport system substrate-binding protein
MRFRIQYKDRIVGVLSMFGIALLLVCIFILGSNQRWFSKDYHYKALLDSASGLTKNMSVTHKGFKIGNVSDFYLNENDDVEVIFIIYDTYNDYVKTGSIVESRTSPIGLGNQFVFYPGLGEEQLPEDSFIPDINSVTAANYIASGLAAVPASGDSIAIMVNRLNKLLGSVNSAIEGNDTTSLGRSVLSVESTLRSLEHSLANVETLSGGIASESVPLFENLEKALESLSGVLANLNKTTEYLPEEMPEISATITELRQSLMSAEDVLKAMSNNPLLKGGIPERPDTRSSGTNPRNIQF